MIGVGDRAPDFSLDGLSGDGAERRTFSLSEFAGTPVVLVFYPKDNSPICTAQLRSYTDDIGAFSDVGAQVLALSPQRLDEHAQFVASSGPFAFPLLDDSAKTVGSTYGVLGPLGFYRRSVVIVDGAGVVRWSRKAAAGLTFRPVDEIVDSIRALSI